MKTIRWFTTQSYSNRKQMRDAVETVNLPAPIKERLVNELNDKFHQVAWDVEFDDDGHIHSVTPVGI